MITKSQIAKIARETKSLHSEGLGNQLAIFADGSISEQSSRQSLTCFLHSDGSRTYPLCWISTPQTRRSTEEIIRYAEEQDRIAEKFAVEESR